MKKSNKKTMAIIVALWVVLGMAYAANAAPAPATAPA